MRTEKDGKFVTYFTVNHEGVFDVGARAVIDGFTALDLVGTRFRIGRSFW